MTMKATTIAVTAILLLGGLYLYMNRFEYLDRGVGDSIQFRINKLTGEACYNFGLFEDPWECTQPGQN